MSETNESGPMHPTLKAMALESAKRHREDTERVEREARAIRLCPPDCPERHPRFPEQHAHTYLDMLRMGQAADYGWQLLKAQEQAGDIERVDVVPHLRRAGAGEVHLEGFKALQRDRPAVLVAARWLKQPRRADGSMTHPWLALLGDRNTGKTQAAVYALAYFVRRHPWNATAGFGDAARDEPFVVAHASELPAVARGRGDYSEATSAGRRERMLRLCKVLVVDDIGSEKMNDDTLDLIGSLLDERYRARRVTIVTSNLSGVELERRVDFRGGETPKADDERGRIWRRILQHGHVAQFGKGGRVRCWVGGEEVKP
jgi:hypothetical protein